MNPSPKCVDCPFFNPNPKFFLPTPPDYSQGVSLAVLIGESPGHEEKWKEKPFVGPTGRVMWDKMQKLGLKRSSFHILNRIACCPPRNKKTDKNMKKAADCCKPYFDSCLEKCKKLPRLYMGKYSWNGELSATQALLSKNVITDRAMILDHPTFVFYHKTTLQVAWLAALERFIAYIQNQEHCKPWAELHINASDKSLQALKRLGSLVAWDVETLGIDPRDPEFKITCIGFSDGIHSVSIPWDTYSTETQGTVWGLDYFGKLGSEIRNEVIKLFQSDRIFAAHNGNYDLLATQARGLIARNDFDTMVAYAILYPEIPKNLEDAALHLTGAPERWKTIYDLETKALKKIAKERRFFEVSFEKLRAYNSHDAQATAWLAQYLRPIICNDSRLFELYKNAANNMNIVREMRHWGWTIDEERQAFLNRELETRILEATNAAGQLLTNNFSDKEISEFNFNSNRQLQYIFYSIFEEPVRFRTPQGAPATNKQALEHITRSTNETASKLAEALLRRKSATKLQDAFINNLKGNTRAYPSFNVVGQVSGRWSVTEPALQTTPAVMKSMFVSHPGNWLVLADFSQLELRINAQIAQDMDLVQAYYNGIDVHQLNASALFDLPLEQAIGHWRHSAKTFAYRLSYCTMDEEGAAMGIFDTLSILNKNITYRACLAAVRRWWKQHPRLYASKKETLEKALKNWYVEEPFLHRRRYFYGPKLPKETEIFNFPMQAGGAAIVDKATQAVHDNLNHEIEHLLLQRHDELVVEGPDPIRLAKVLFENMTQEYEIAGVKMIYPVELKVGLRWGKEVAIGYDIKEKVFNVECKCERDKDFKAQTETLEKATLIAVNHVGTCVRTAEKPEVLDKAKALR
mgnify:FL=1